MLYTSSQHVWKTTNGGQNWDKISPDLTRHDPKTMGRSGGPITHDMNAPEVYGTVFAIGPGKKDVNIIWAGSDDGLVHVTRDGGKTWTNVTPKDMPDFGRVSQIDASSVRARRRLRRGQEAAARRPRALHLPHARLRQDVDEDRHRHPAPTTTCTSCARTRRAAGLLYAGTQHGVYVSYDDGDTWESLSLNLPDVPVSDLIVEANSIAIATHGRGFYILDDIAPLRASRRSRRPARTSSSSSPPTRSAAPAARRSRICCSKPAEKLTIEILDAKGQVVQTIQGARAGAGAAGAGAVRAGAARCRRRRAEARGSGEGGRRRARPRRPADGVDGRGPQPRHVGSRLPRRDDVPGHGAVGRDDERSGRAAGHLPGPADRRRQVADAAARREAASAARRRTDADLQEQFDLAIQIRDKVSEANNAVIQIRKIKERGRRIG